MRQNKVKKKFGVAEIVLIFSILILVVVVAEVIVEEILTLPV